MTRTTTMTPEEAREAAERLAEIKDEVKALMDEAGDLLRRAGVIREQARSYWLAHILTNLDHDHDWMAREMFTMQDAVDALEELAEGGEPDDEDDAA